MDVSPGGSGTVLVNGENSATFPFTYSYESPTLVRLEAIPAPGYQFRGWRRDMTGTENPTEFTVDCYKVISADFVPIIYTLDVKTSGAGTTTPQAGAHQFAATSVITLEAIPDDGWQFDGWSGDVADAASEMTTVTIDANKEVTANFSSSYKWLVSGGAFGIVVLGIISLYLVRRNRKS